MPLRAHQPPHVLLRPAGGCGGGVPAVRGVRGDERWVIRDAVLQGVRVKGALVDVGAATRQRLLAVRPAEVVAAQGVLAALPGLRWQRLRRGTQGSSITRASQRWSAPAPGSASASQCQSAQNAGVSIRASQRWSAPARGSASASQCGTQGSAPAPVPAHMGGGGGGLAWRTVATAARKVPLSI